MRRRRHRWTCLVASLLLVAALGHAAPRGADVTRIRGDLASATEALRGDRLDRAAELYRTVITETEAWNRPNLLLARAVDGLADVNREQGRYARAETLYLRAIPLWEQLLGADQPRLATTLNNLAAIYVDQGRLEEAEPRLRRARDIWTASFGADSEPVRVTERAYRSLMQGLEHQRDVAR